jgi:hypothetical protein
VRETLGKVQEEALLGADEPVAWARAWVFDPTKKLGKLRPVTLDKLQDDDVPLYRK